MARTEWQIDSLAEVNGREAYLDWHFSGTKKPLAGKLSAAVFFIAPIWLASGRIFE
ncbi:MAG: hypothetical protein R3E67_08125 [Pseudomonadales bacterium]